MNVDVDDDYDPIKTRMAHAPVGVAEAGPHPPHAPAFAFAFGPRTVAPHVPSTQPQGLKCSSKHARLPPSPQGWPHGPHPIIITLCMHIPMTCIRDP